MRHVGVDLFHHSMEAIRHLIAVFVKIAFGFFGLAIVWWLVSILFPGMSFSAIVSDVKTEKKDWLPPPRNYSGLLKNKTAQNEYTNVYKPAPAFDGYGVNNNAQYTYSNYDYIQYTSTGTAIVKGEETHAPSATGGNAVYIRNLSIYNGQYVKQGLSFVGEARSEFFQNDRFSVIMLNKDRQVIGVFPAYASTQWSTPGWVRFQGLITFPLPLGACTMLFEQALPPTNHREPIRIPQPLNCLQ